MKRDAELRSPIGQTALYYYQLWMRNMKRMPPPAGSFASSRYFRTFVNFVKWTHKVHLPKVDKFIWLMVQKDFSPIMWMNHEVYAIFLEYLDREASGIDSATLSIQTLMAYCDRNEIPLDEVFKHIPIEEIISLLQLRKLSPWLLLHSRTFKQAFVHRAGPEQRVVLESLIRPEYWPDKMAQYPGDVAKIKTWVAEMGI